MLSLRLCVTLCFTQYFTRIRTLRAQIRYMFSGKRPPTFAGPMCTRCPGAEGPADAWCSYIAFRSNYGHQVLLFVL